MGLITIRRLGLINYGEITITLVKIILYSIPTTINN